MPTAFYRHFDSIESLGLALVDESFVSLRAMLRDVRRPRRPDVQRHRRRLRRDAGASTSAGSGRTSCSSPASARPGRSSVREAIRHEIELCERELATDLARLPGTEPLDRRGPPGALQPDRDRDGRRTAEQLLVDRRAPRGRERREGDRPRPPATQLRMVLIGALNWESDRDVSAVRETASRPAGPGLRPRAGRPSAAAGSRTQRQVADRRVGTAGRARGGSRRRRSPGRSSARRRTSLPSCACTLRLHRVAVRPG